MHIIPLLNLFWWVVATVKEGIRGDYFSIDTECRTTQGLVTMGDEAVGKLYVFFSGSGYGSDEVVRRLYVISSGSRYGSDEVVKF